MSKYEIRFHYYPWVWLFKDNEPYFAVFDPPLVGKEAKDFNLFEIMMNRFETTAKEVPALVRNMKPNVLIYYSGRSIPYALKFRIPEQAPEVWARIKDSPYGNKFFSKIFGGK